MPLSRDAELIHLIALLRSRSRGSGYADVTAAVVEAGSPTALWTANQPDALFEDPDRDETLALAAAELQAWRDRGIAVTPYFDPTYPAQLREIHQMPPIVWTRGLLLAGDRGVSVVGTRTPSHRGERFARDVAKGLADQGLTVVSGLAAGVDTAAHSAALESGGRTVAVLGTGLDRSYPRPNQELQAVIGERGLLLSQFWPESSPTKASFPMRNAVMSGYSRVSVVVEAGEHSGTRIQGRVAVAHGRPVILTSRVVDETAWGRALAGRPGVHVVSSAAEAVTLAEELSRPVLPGVGELLQSLKSA